jgi:hypothetical protein
MPRHEKVAPSAGLVQAIGVQLACLTNLLGDAVERLTDAQGYLDNGELNAAIGTVLDLEERLADASALHRGILVLHRRR